MTHTKGPWGLTVTDDQYDGKHKITDANGDDLMCDMAYYPWCPTKDDDWHLIAAAPELLEALKAVLNYAGDDCAVDDKDYQSNIDFAIAAIAKAEGRT